MNEKDYKEKIKLALSVVEHISEANLRAIAFECVLNKLLALGINLDKNITTIPSDALANNQIVISKKSKTNLSEEILADVFGVEAEKIDLKIKVEGEKLSEQQRKLAHVMLYGYKFLLGVTEVKGSTILKIAKDWDIKTGHFTRNVKGSKYIQTKNSGKGKDPTYILKPGSLDFLSEEIKSLF